jgi:hypothetical protein
MESVLKGTKMRKLRKTKESIDSLRKKEQWRRDGTFRDVHCPYCGAEFAEAHKAGACMLWQHVTGEHALMAIRVGPLVCPCGYNTSDDYKEESASNRIHWLYEHCCRLSKDQVELHILLFSMGATLRNTEPNKDVGL